MAQWYDNPEVTRSKRGVAARFVFFFVVFTNTVTISKWQ